MILKLSPRACVAAGAIRAFLRPVLAFDARGFDPAPLLTDITSRNFKAKVPEIVARVKTATARMIARDAAPDPKDLQALLEALGEQGEAEDGERDPTNPANFTSRHEDARSYTNNEANPDKPDDSDRTRLGNPADDEDEDDEDLGDFLEQRLSPGDMQRARNLLDKVYQDGDADHVDEHKAAELLDFLAPLLSESDLQRASDLLIGAPAQPGDPVEDAPPSSPGMPRLGGRMARDERLRRARTLAYDARTRMLDSGAATFARMFPGIPTPRSLDAPAGEVRREPIDYGNKHAQMMMNKFPSRVV